MADRVRLEVHWAFQNLPVHAGFTLSDLDRLFTGELIAQTVPGSSAGVGHGFNEMSHRNDSLRMSWNERRFISRLRVLTTA